MVTDSVFPDKVRVTNQKIGGFMLAPDGSVQVVQDRLYGWF